MSVKQLSSMFNNISDNNNKLEVEKNQKKNLDNKLKTIVEKKLCKSNENQQFEGYLSMDAFRKNKMAGSSAANTASEIPPDLPPKIPKFFHVPPKQNPQNEYINFKQINFGTELKLNDEFEEIENNYDLANCEKISERSTLESDQEINLVSPLLAIKWHEVNSNRNPVPLPRYNTVLPTVETEKSPDINCAKKIPKTLIKHSKSLDSTLNEQTENLQLSLSLNNIKITQNPPKFSSKFKLATSTQSIIENELFANNEQIETSNSIDVESKIADIIYGRKKIKFSDCDYQFFKQAVRLSYLNLQSDDNLIDDFDSDSWDENEEEIDYANTTFSDLQTINLLDLVENEQTQTLKWSKIMKKKDINISHLTEKEIKLQDAKFELFAAESSFLKALNVLYEQFLAKLCIILSKNESDTLFSYVKEVKECSKKFLGALEKTWNKNKFTEEFCRIIFEYLQTNFDVYVGYSANQAYSEQLLGELISGKSRTFTEILNDLQSDPKCNGLHLHAYQLIPIRKINNFPNLLKNIFQHLEPNDKEYNLCKTAMDFSKKLLIRCNNESQNGKDLIKTKSVVGKLDFPKNSSLKLNQTGNIHMRKFIKSDKMELIELTNSLFGKKTCKKPVFVFLFNDLFVLARIKSNTNRYQVIDYCFRINIEIDPNPIFLNISTNGLNRNAILYLHIKENKDLKPTEMILHCSTKTDKIRWIEALDPPDTAKSDRHFDFEFVRKVIVQRNSSAVHSDEINIIIGEELKILRDTEDGWSFGQRVKDGVCGWFPTANVILSDDIARKVQERNVRKM